MSKQLDGRRSCSHGAAQKEEDAVQLLADRFAAIEGGKVVDLATGESVVLAITSAGGAAEQRGWAIRCDTLHKLGHPAVAQLVDYGDVGEVQRFEAWRWDRVWSGTQ